MEQKEVNLQKIIKVLFFIIMTFSCVFGALSTRYFDVYISLVFLLPPLISAAYLYYAFEKYDLKYIQFVERGNSRKNLSLRLVIGFILGYSVLPITYLLFSEPITTKILYLSVIVGLINLFIPLIGKRRIAEAKSWVYFQSLRRLSLQNYSGISNWYPYFFQILANNLDRYLKFGIELLFLFFSS